MNFWVFVIVVVAIGSVTSIISQGLQLASRKAKYSGAREEVDRLNAVIGSMAADMDKLKGRVQVLEKLLTDDDRRLASEIERLRSGEMRP